MLTALAGAVFASTTCILDNVRSKDTPITNAFFGGMAAGLVAGSKCEPYKHCVQLNCLRLYNNYVNF